jgi:hypothetical protein
VEAAKMEEIASGAIHLAGAEIATRQSGGLSSTPSSKTALF